MKRAFGLFRSSAQHDVDEELRFHFESRIEELVASGMSAADARAQATREFGDVDEVRRGLVTISQRVAARRSRLETLYDVLLDVRYAVRSLRRTPGMAIAILCTLALGIGANAAMFSLLEALYLRAPAGVVEPNRVHRVWEERKYTDGRQFTTVMSYVQYEAVRDALAGLTTTAVYRLPYKTKIGRGEMATQAQVSYAQSDFFALLGVRPRLGRIYDNVEDRLGSASPVAVLSESYWRREYGGDASVLGKTILVQAKPYTIVGVVSTFTGIELNAADVWIPLEFAQPTRGGKPWWNNPDMNGLTIILRERSASIAEMEQRITAALRRDGIARRPGDSTVVRLGGILQAAGPGQRSQEESIGIRLAGVVVIVLLIACANVVNLLLARAVRRRREIAVRLALGITRGRLVRLLITESVVLALAAAVVSLLLAMVGGTLLRRLLFPDIHWAGSALNWTVALFALGIALVCGFAAGLVPALQSASPNLTASLKSGDRSGGHHTSRLRNALVAAQGALCVLLLIGAVLFVRSLANVRDLDLGFDRRRVFSAAVAFDDQRLVRDSSIGPRMYEVAERAGRLPGIERAAVTSMEPMYGFSMIPYFTERDSIGSRERWYPTATAVTRGFFATTGLRITRGGDFTASSRPEIIVNEEMARRLWPGREAIGQCVQLVSRAAPCSTVVGVVETGRMDKIIEEPKPQFFLPLDRLPEKAKEYMGPSYVIARSSSDDLSRGVSALRDLMRQQFPGSIPQIHSLDERLDPQYRPWRLGATLFSAFGALALIVAVVGIYSTVSYGVNQRLHEFGVRVALGARVGDVIRLVVGQGVRTVAIGVAIGVLLSLAAGKLIASLLYGVSPRDPLALAVVVVVLLATGALAALMPAWRASRVDPVGALRAD
jgi:predicted permease